MSSTTTEKGVTRSYNSEANVFVRVAPLKTQKKCPHSYAMFSCKERATQVATLGRHSSITCDDDDHQESARLEVAQMFVDDMIDVHGNVPEWKSAKR